MCSLHPLTNGGLYIDLHLQREGNTDKVIYRNSTIRPVSSCIAAPPCGQIVHFTWAASQEGIENVSPVLVWFPELKWFALLCDTVHCRFLLFLRGTAMCSICASSKQKL